METKSRNRILFKTAYDKYLGPSLLSAPQDRRTVHQIAGIKPSSLDSYEGVVERVLDRTAIIAGAALGGIVKRMTVSDNERPSSVVKKEKKKDNPVHTVFLK